MSYRETDLTADYSKWLRTSTDKQLMKHDYLIEFKIKHGKEKLNLLRDFRPHQIPTLIQVEHGCVYHKMSDQAIGIKPCDSFSICNKPGYIGVMWYKLRQPKILYVIDVKHIKSRMDDNEYKLDEVTAKEMATHIINLSKK